MLLGTELASFTVKVKKCISSRDKSVYKERIQLQRMSEAGDWIMQTTQSTDQTTQTITVDHTVISHNQWDIHASLEVALRNSPEAQQPWSGRYTHIHEY